MIWRLRTLLALTLLALSGGCIRLARRVAPAP
jgi:hypothetical protein